MTTKHIDVHVFKMSKSHPFIFKFFEYAILASVLALTVVCTRDVLAQEPAPESSLEEITISIRTHKDEIPTTFPLKNLAENPTKANLFKGGSLEISAKNSTDSLGKIKSVQIVLVSFNHDKFSPENQKPLLKAEDGELCNFSANTKCVFPFQLFARPSNSDQEVPSGSRLEIRIATDNATYRGFLTVEKWGRFDLVKPYVFYAVPVKDESWSNAENLKILSPTLGLNIANIVFYTNTGLIGEVALGLGVSYFTGASFINDNTTYIAKPDALVMAGLDVGKFSIGFGWGITEPKDKNAYVLIGTSLWDALFSP